MLQTVRQGMVASLDAGLTDELLAAYQEAKRNFYLGGLRLSAVEGGRLCEAAFRLLAAAAGGCIGLKIAVGLRSLLLLLCRKPALQRHPVRSQWRHNAC